MFKRIFWFSAVNIAVLFLISLILSLFNTQNYLAASGIGCLLVFFAIIGLQDFFLFLTPIMDGRIASAYKLSFARKPTNNGCS